MVTKITTFTELKEVLANITREMVVSSTKDFYEEGERDNSFVDSLISKMHEAVDKESPESQESLLRIYKGYSEDILIRLQEGDITLSLEEIMTCYKSKEDYEFTLKLNERINNVLIQSLVGNYLTNE